MIESGGEEYVDKHEAARILHRTERTVVRYASEGLLKRYYKGFRALYKREEVDALARSLEEVRPEEPEEK